MCIFSAEQGSSAWTGDGGSQTAFRRWLSAEVSIPEEEGPVLGLRAVLQEAGLASFTMEVEAWCEDSGAAFLEELGAGELEAMCEDLRLSQPHRQQLRCALARRDVDFSPAVHAESSTTLQRTMSVSYSCAAFA